MGTRPFMVPITRDQMERYRELVKIPPNTLHRAVSITANLFLIATLCAFIHFLLWLSGMGDKEELRSKVLYISLTCLLLACIALLGICTFIFMSVKKHRLFEKQAQAREFLSTLGIPPTAHVVVDGDDCEDATHVLYVCDRSNTRLQETT